MKLALIKTQTSLSSSSSFLSSSSFSSSHMGGGLSIDSRWLINVSDLSFLGKIGSGAFGLVHKYAINQSDNVFISCFHILIIRCVL